MRRALIVLVFASLACGDERRATPDAEVLIDDVRDEGDVLEEVEIAPSGPVTITVLLDGTPAAGARVTQGGVSTSAVTGDDGRVTLEVDTRVAGEIAFMASLPSARIKGADWSPGKTSLIIALTSFDPTDNPAYLFQDPGEPGRRENTGQCGHCHVTMNDDWYASPHRTSAANPTLNDLYTGSAAAFSEAEPCRQAGGRWMPGAQPGKSPGRCVLGAGVLATLNPSACADGECSGSPTAFGACADCHAPGIDGAELGGKDLRAAEGHAADYGVHCDVCHKVAAIDLSAPAGVAGRLVMHRPSERSSSIGLGTWQPLTFGPHHDVSNPRMGLTQRDHFTSASLCAGCHQYDQPTAGADPARWPDARLPIHTTYDEWLASPLNPDTTCQGCHMPPDAEVSNGADLQLFGGDDASGVAAGWRRPIGAVKQHSFVGPRQRASQLLESAASLAIEKVVADGRVTARVTVQNVFPGHAIPTGEPLRSLVVMVAARCGEAPLLVIGGDAIPDFGGALATQLAGDDWTRWPGARPGELVRIVQRLEAYHDYDGFGPFQAAPRGRFSAAEKGMHTEHVVAELTIVAVAPDGTVEFDRALPEIGAGMIAYRGTGAGVPADGDAATARAGAPGFAFARVLVGADGARMVPHFLAVDVASDNRLLPGAAWTSEHVFAATCADPSVHATLVHRAYPLALASERGWRVVESVMRSATR